MAEWLTDLELDIHTTMIVLIAGLVILGLIVIYYGIKTINYSFEVTYVKKRRKFLQQGWRIVIVAIIAWIFALALGLYGEPLVYQVYIPSSTVTLTPSITPSLTITLTPTLTLSPTVTRTPSITPTPSVPESIATQFEGTLEPGSNIIFSQISFSDAIDEYYQPIEARITFSGPLETVYGSFTYNNMQPGLQWSAIWVNPNGEVVCYETEVWGDYTGGYGYTSCRYDEETWVEGEFQVQMFLGMVWWQTNTFWFGQPDETEATVSP